MIALEKARVRSEKAILELRRQAKEFFGTDQNLVVGINGSYARREATSGSDLDIFYLYTSTVPVDEKRKVQFDNLVVGSGFKLPSSEGVFSNPLLESELLKNIGGMDDNNVSITRRLLLLLEGDWLHNREGFDLLRSRFFERYVSQQMTADKICLYLLNDIIRYWRTICVDYEFKTVDGKKPRGVRLVKLRFSRLMLIFGGILAVAETHNLNAPEKRERLSELLMVPVLDRVRSVAGERATRALSLYNDFLSDLDNDEIRKVLESNEFDVSKEFNRLRQLSKEFKVELLELLSATYKVNHPIHKALIL
jgi:predicted nucleotidyltransferase